MKKRIALISLFFIVCFCLKVSALEQKEEMLSVSVEVAPTFGLSLDKSSLNFGDVKPGEKKILGEARFFNEVKCRSNYGRVWFLKAKLLSGLKHTASEYQLPISALKWKLAEARSEAKPVIEYQFQEFSNQPDLMYISQGEDNRGKEVILRFQYQLSCPNDAPGGLYSGLITFTMSESP